MIQHRDVCSLKCRAALQKFTKCLVFTRNFGDVGSPPLRQILATIITKTYNYEMPDIILRKINERMIEAQLQELADK